jgi:flavin-dependent dehydrogenase
VRRTAALIVGGGPAGSAAAIMLGRAGLEPELIERSSGPRDVVCGGFLGWDALRALDRLGVDVWALGARPIERVRLIGAGRRVEARLPHRAAGLSRRSLDEALMEAAAVAGAIVTRGVAVRAAEVEGRVRLDTGEWLQAEALLLATGKHELRGLARPSGPAAADPVIGFRTALAPSVSLQQALDGVIELHLFDGGYAGLLLQEDGSANLCVSVARDRISQAGGIAELIVQLGAESPGFGQRLDGSEAPEWQAIAGVPYGWRAKRTAPGVFRLGDQGAVIASLAGDGVAIALGSGMDAAAALLRHGPRGAEAFQAGFAARARRPLSVASKLRRAAENGRARRSMMRLLGVAPFLLSIGARLTRFGS